MYSSYGNFGLFKDYKVTYTKENNKPSFNVVGCKVIFRQEDDKGDIYKLKKLDDKTLLENS